MGANKSVSFYSLFAALLKGTLSKQITITEHRFMRQNASRGNTHRQRLCSTPTFRYATLRASADPWNVFNLGRELFEKEKQ